MTKIRMNGAKLNQEIAITKGATGCLGVGWGHEHQVSSINLPPPASRTDEALGH